MYGSTEPECHSRFPEEMDKWCTLPEGHHGDGNYGDDHKDEHYGTTWSNIDLEKSRVHKSNLLAAFSKKELVDEIYRRDMSSHHHLDDVITEFGFTREELEAELCSDCGWDLDTHDRLGNDCPCPKTPGG